MSPFEFLSIGNCKVCVYVCVAWRWQLIIPVTGEHPAHVEANALALMPHRARDLLSRHQLPWLLTCLSLELITLESVDQGCVRMPKQALASPLAEAGNKEERVGITVGMSYSYWSHSWGWESSLGNFS